MVDSDVSEAIRAFTDKTNKSFARDPEQEREIVPIDEFLSDPYYTGSVNSVIYPYWREKIIEFMNNDEKYEMIVDGSTSSGKCVSAGSRLMLESGEVVTMEEFVNNKEGKIQSLDEETGELVWSDVNDWIDSGKKDVYKFRTNNNYKVKVTSCHPFKTVSDGWVSLNDGLTVGKKIAVVDRDTDDIYYDEIEEIGYVGEEQVYDLEIEGTHNFVANDTVVHNTWSSILCLFYRFYVLSCFKYPQRLFGMSDETRLGLYYFNVKKKIAKNTGYQDLRGFFNESRYFQNETNWDKRKRNSIVLPDKNLVASFGANESDIKGINLLGIVLDETNFFKKSGSSSKADLQKVRNIYTDAIDRITQRFHTEGSNPGLAIVISSATEDDSFLEERKEATGRHIFYVKAVKHKVDGDYTERFWVFGGTQKVDPCILKSVDHLKTVLDDVDLNFDVSELDDADDLGEAIGMVPTEIRDRFDNPPEDWRERYEYDMESALQNRSGIPTGRQGKLFTNKEKWNGCEEQRPFPFHSKHPVVSTEDPETLDSYFKKEVLCEQKQLTEDISEWIPKVNPGARRFFYADLSATTDPSGIAMVHVEDIGETEGSGMKYPFVYVDFMLQVKPPEAPARLDHDKILDFVGLLKNKYQFDIQKFATDQYAGETVTQRLNKNLFTKEDEEALVLRPSLDTTDQHWLEFTRLLYKGFIRFPKYDIFRKEFMNLDHERSDESVDHPDEFPDGSVGTKDVSDAVVGATTLALNDEDIQAREFPDSAEEILTDEGHELVDEHGNVDFKNWRGSSNEMPFKDKSDVIEDKRDEEIIDLL